MPVVINEVQVMPDARPLERSAGGGAASEAAPPAEMEPAEVARVMRGLERRALRVWAH